MVGKRTFLSKGGRLNLIDSVLSVVLTYYLSLFRLLSGVSDELERIMRNFLWKGVDEDGGDHLVSWKTCSRSKKKGGLGIGNLRCKNKALLFKWLWRFLNEQDTLWAKVIRSKFGLHSNNWDSGSTRKASFRSPWKFISSLYEELLLMASFKVGNGRRIRFWEDAWWGEEAFSS